MKASVGDRIIIASTKIDGPVRDGRIVEVRHADGSPPYLVDWSDGAPPALVFPGPDAHVEAAGTTPKASGRLAQSMHVRSWRIQVDLFEGDDETNAHAVLITQAPTHLDAHGTARRKAGDPDIPEIGDEIAVARALRGLADRLLGTAAEDIAAVEGHPVSLHS